MLLTTPLIRAAKNRWPAAHIAVLGFDGTLGMLRGNADVAELIEVPGRAGARATWSLVRRLWRRYDLALITQDSDRAHGYGWLAAPLRAGLVSGRRRTSWWKRALLVHAVRVAGDRSDVHVVDEKLALLAPWRGAGDDGSDAGRAPPDVSPPALEALPGDIASVLAPIFVVVHVPSMWRYKQWPLGHFERLIAALVGDGVQVVLSGSGSVDDRAKVDAMCSLAEPPLLLDFAGRLVWGQFATLLQRAALYIGPDTSATHLAAARRVPVIALFGPTNPARWGPLPASDASPPAGHSRHRPAYVQRQSAPQRAGRVILIQGPGDCVPCGRAGCDDHRESRSACLEGIGPDLVIAEARRRLAATFAAL